MKRSAARLTLRFLASGAGLLPFRLPAQPAAPPPTVITSDSATSRSTDAETTSFFYGHVEVAGNNLDIHCDRLEVISQRKSGDASDTIGDQSSFKYILATGRVRIVQGDREAVCGRAEVLPAENKITLTDHPVVTDHSNGVTYAGEPLILYRNERRVEGRHVRIVGPPIKNLGLEAKPAPAPPSPPAKQP